MMNKEGQVYVLKYSLSTIKLMLFPQSNRLADLNDTYVLSIKTGLGCLQIYNGTH